MLSITKFIEKRKLLVFVIVFSVLYFLFLGKINLFDWDEANFAELAREMILSKNYLQPQINYLPFYEKPPLYIWMQVFSMKLFGIHEFASRFPNALLGIINIVSLYLIGKKLRNDKFGLIWAIVYSCSLLPFLYFRSGLIDPWFNYFMMLSIYFQYEGFKNTDSKYSFSYIILSALVLGFAVQTKGQVAMILVWGTIGLSWLLYSRKKIYLILVWVLLSVLFSSFWFLYETYSHGSLYIEEFIKYQIRLLTTEDALHGGPIYYHIITLLLGCFPASFFFISYLFKRKTIEFKIFEKTMMILLILVVVIFSLVQTKIIHYSSMAYYPITYFSALYLYKTDFQIQNKYMKSVLIFFSFLLVFILLFIPYLGMNMPKFIHYINDAQAVERLSQSVNWGLNDFIYGFFLLFLLISLLYRKKVVFAVFSVSVLFIFFSLIVFGERIETYVQGPEIGFYKSKKGEVVDMQPMYFKSYACYFYQDVQPFQNDTSKTIAWKFNLNDRNMYFFTIKKNESKLPKLGTKVYDSFGFVAYYKKAYIKP